MKAKLVKFGLLILLGGVGGGLVGYLNQCVGNS